MISIWDKFAELGPEPHVEVIYDCGCFYGSARWSRDIQDEEGELHSHDIKVEMAFDEACPDNDFDAFINQLYEKALEEDRLVGIMGLSRIRHTRRV